MKYTTMVVEELVREEAREKMLRRVVGFLSAAVIIAMMGWGLYFWHLYRVYLGR